MSLLFVNGVSKPFTADPNHVCALLDCLLPIFFVPGSEDAELT